MSPAWFLENEKEPEPEPEPGPSLAAQRLQWELSELSAQTAALDELRGGRAASTAFVGKSQSCMPNTTDQQTNRQEQSRGARAVATPGAGAVHAVQHRARWQQGCRRRYGARSRAASGAVQSSARSFSFSAETMHAS